MTLAYWIKIEVSRPLPGLERATSREKGIVVLNRKSGDFGSYTLPRLSIQSHGQEGEPQAPAHSAVQTGGERREAGRVDTEARVKGKINCKQKI